VATRVEDRKEITCEKKILSPGSMQCKYNIQIIYKIFQNTVNFNYLETTRTTQKGIEKIKNKLYGEMPWLLFKSRIGVGKWNRLKESGLVAVSFNMAIKLWFS